MNYLKIPILFMMFFTSLFSQVQIHNPKIDSLFTAGKFDKIISLVNPADTLNSFSSNNYYKIGLAYQCLYKHLNAAEVFKKAAKLDSLNSKYYSAAASSYSMLGISDFAEENYRLAFRLDSSDISTTISFGNSLIENGKFSDASQVYRFLINNDSTNSIFFKQLAYCFFKTGNDSSAILNYKKSISLNPQNKNSILTLAQIYKRKELPDSALSILDLGLQFYPHDISLNRFKADLHFQKKEHFWAVSHFGKAIAYGDSSASNFQKLGLSYYFIAASDAFRTLKERDKKFQNAIDALLQARELDKKDHLTCMYLGVGYKEIGNFEKAIEYLKITIDLMIPEYAGDVYTYLAGSYQLKNNFPETIRSYKKAIEFNPSEKLLLYFLATVYDKWYEDKTDALNLYQKFLDCKIEVDPAITKYARGRIEAIQEYNHFNGK